MRNHVDQYQVNMLNDDLIRVDHVRMHRLSSSEFSSTRFFKSVEMLPTWMQEAMALLFVMNTKEEWGIYTIDGVGSMHVGGKVYRLDIPTAGGESR